MTTDRRPQRLGRGEYLYTVGGVLYEIILSDDGRCDEPARWKIRVVRRRDWLGAAPTLEAAMQLCDDFIPF